MTTGLAQKLTATAEAVEQVPPGAAPVSQLAQAWNGFYVARIVSVILDAEVVPRRDTYALAETWCTGALEALYEAAGRDEVRRHSPDHTAGEPRLLELTVAGQAELAFANDADTEQIAAAMARLAGALENLLSRVAEDEAVLPECRAAARLALPAAHDVWAHYGGDPGGW